MSNVCESIWVTFVGLFRVRLGKLILSNVCGFILSNVCGSTWVTFVVLFRVTLVGLFRVTLMGQFWVTFVEPILIKRNIASSSVMSWLHGYTYYLVVLAFLFRKIVKIYCVVLVCQQCKCKIKNIKTWLYFCFLRFNKKYVWNKV